MPKMPKMTGELRIAKVLIDATTQRVNFTLLPHPPFTQQAEAERYLMRRIQETDPDSLSGELLGSGEYVFVRVLSRRMVRAIPRIEYQIQPQEEPVSTDWGVCLPDSPQDDAGDHVDNRGEPEFEPFDEFPEMDLSGVVLADDDAEQQIPLISGADTAAKS